MLKLSSCHGPVPSGRTKRLTEALRMAVRGGDVQQFALRQPFQDVADQQDDGVVADQQHPLAGVQAVQVGQQGAQAQDDVGPGFAAGRAVVELAQPAPPLRFLGQPGLHAGGGEHVQDAELAVTQPFVQPDRRRPARRYGTASSAVCRARRYGEDHTAARPSAGNPASRRPSASACSRPVPDSSTSASRAGTLMTCAPDWCASVAATLPWLSPCRTSSSSAMPAGRSCAGGSFRSRSPLPPGSGPILSGCHVTTGALACRRPVPDAGDRRRGTGRMGPCAFSSPRTNSRAPLPPSKPPPPSPKAPCASIPTPRPSSFRWPTAAKEPSRRPSPPGTRSG